MYKQDGLSHLYRAIGLGLSDYLDKTGLKSVILGVSGGIDSALVAHIAVDCLGADRVWAVFLPSIYTSERSMQDAKELVARLGIRSSELSIQAGFDLLKGPLSTLSNAPDPLLDTEITMQDNLQARLRGLMLMALSNRYGGALLNTGNKSELAMGYTTLYGDLCGAYAPIKDVYKTQVFALARWRNDHIENWMRYKKKDAIPHSILSKPPSAELHFNQIDQDSLPPYSHLDPILYEIIEKKSNLQTLIHQGYEEKEIHWIWSKLCHGEFKRRQGPIGPKVSQCSFDRDWRMPIAHHFSF
jgi:NAD+ synthetase